MKTLLGSLAISAAMAVEFQIQNIETEHAPYTVVKTDGDFEIRDYDTQQIVQTEDDKEAFQRLYDFIAGNNSEGMEIPMTAPVYTLNAHAIADMAFVMPAHMSEEDVPEPKDPEVSRDRIQAGRFSAVRYNGWNNEKTELEMEKKLIAWMKENDVAYMEDEEALVAQFDSPWVPGFLRHNEVMFRMSNN